MTDDGYYLQFTYKPVGEITGTFQIEVPTGSGWDWEYEDTVWNIATPGADLVRSGRRLSGTFPEKFGSMADDNLVITLENVTAPNRHNMYQFTTTAGSKRLTTQPKVFVGNIVADEDTGTVGITPEAVYVGEMDRNFEIKFTANGPMHDSEIQITIPSDITDLPQMTTPTDPGLHP